MAGFRIRLLPEAVHPHGRNAHRAAIQTLPGVTARVILGGISAHFNLPDTLLTQLRTVGSAIWDVTSRSGDPGSLIIEKTIAAGHRDSAGTNAKGRPNQVPCDRWFDACELKCGVSKPAIETPAGLMGHSRPAWICQLVALLRSIN